MKRLWLALVIATIFAGCATAQLTLPLGGLSGPSEKKTKPTSKMLTGTVWDKSEKPIPGAVVYLKNMKTLAVKSYFADKDGAYRFPQLALNTDYEVYAEIDGKKSDTKSISQFDDRFNPTINLKINLDK
ncbi:MAG: carboxypeptidase-like regulatory domain-containing protein [Candidatus Korobacteraceae bacterium]